MISLLLTAAVAAGAANVALVAFLADRLSPKAGTVAAGEFVAVAGTASASGKVSRVKAGNENVPAVAGKLAA
ncbi:hypothetical protein [Methylobacterium oxalidis]|uniref:Uncharacterized protein n=1 Tax=Methylobacterium oxalidis TaxID=944322 RepID=A0A512IXR2_9HYPH|nr:hypothetical protein [Methylobacterium oxalidis]GEP02504.1 hypothetical protein MOX02_05420 [Methylobacterium oxalidis]GJE32018.1 hypothetical protein LDDCCGHA_2200 [Methylobacterium oxalidis]GLS67883.1 hypothetical protein GCM10007888_62680 [Methylobacterium oxalidis]